MSDPIIVYSNGDQFEIDREQLYDPFPEPVEKPTDDKQEETSQE